MILRRTWDYLPIQYTDPQSVFYHLLNHAIRPDKLSIWLPRSIQTWFTPVNRFSNAADDNTITRLLRYHWIPWGRRKPLSCAAGIPWAKGITPNRKNIHEDALDTAPSGRSYKSDKNDWLSLHCKLAYRCNLRRYHPRCWAKSLFEGLCLINDIGTDLMSWLQGWYARYKSGISKGSTYLPTSMTTKESWVRSLSINFTQISKVLTMGITNWAALWLWRIVPIRIIHTLENPHCWESGETERRTGVLLHNGHNNCLEVDQWFGNLYNSWNNTPPVPPVSLCTGLVWVDRSQMQRKGILKYS
jgi:hypothetical protein